MNVKIIYKILSEDTLINFLPVLNILLYQSLRVRFTHVLAVKSKLAEQGRASTAGPKSGI